MDNSGRDLRYGCGPWKPKCLQTLNNAGAVLAFLALGNCFQSMVINGLMGVVLSTIEKRFDLSSSESSLIASAYEIGTVPILLIISFVGTRIHRPRAVCGGLIIIAVGCVLFFLPHFTTPEYRPEGQGYGNNLCRNRSEDPSICDGSGLTAESYSNYLPQFIVARLLHGIGATPIYVLGVTFLDDCVTKETFSMYVAVFYALGVIGPAIGTIGGGFLLNLFTDFPTVSSDELDIDNSDPRWVGAWWLPFTIGMALIVLTAIPIAGFARDIPGAAEIRSKKKSEANQMSAKKADDNADRDFATCKELPGALLTLFTNPTYIMLTLFICCDSLIVAGFTAFGPKYLENQYSLPASLSGALFGAVLLPAGAGGTLIGGAIIERMRLKCKQIIRGEIVLTALVLILGSIFFLTCENLNFAGVNQPYNGTVGQEELTYSINGTCNQECMCEEVTYNPVCSHDNVKYYSPCHAGCDGMTENEDGTTEYYNCGCIFPPINVSITPWATKAECSVDSCRFLPAFLVLFFIAVVMIFMCSAMNISALVRSVPTSQRSMAISIQWIFLRLLGTIPGPVAFGSAFDTACLLWDETCGQRKSCLYYKNSTMSLYLFIVCFSVKVASLIFLIIGIIFYKAPPEDPSVTEEVKESGKDISEQRHPNKQSVSNGTIDYIPADDMDRVRYGPHDNLAFQLDEIGNSKRNVISTKF